jgi:hypothetical protein
MGPLAGVRAGAWRRTAPPEEGSTLPMGLDDRTLPGHPGCLALPGRLLARELGVERLLVKVPSKAQDRASGFRCHTRQRRSLWKGWALAHDAHQRSYPHRHPLRLQGALTPPLEQIRPPLPIGPLLGRRHFGPRPIVFTVISAN